MYILFAPYLIPPLMPDRSKMRDEEQRRSFTSTMYTVEKEPSRKVIMIKRTIHTGVESKTRCEGKSTTIGQ